jgi:hypothetical protein
MGCAVLLVKANAIFMDTPAAGRAAMYSILRLVSLTVPLCSLGLLGASGGSDEEKFHSSSSLDTVGRGGGAGEWLEVENAAPRAAKGSEEDAAGCGGGWYCEGIAMPGCGVADLEAGGEVKEANWEKAGVELGAALLLSWVMEERRAGPGISRRGF